jgi:hypothetical protein
MGRLRTPPRGLPLVGKVGLDNDIGLHISQALALTPPIHLFNLRVIELQTGLASEGTFFDTADIVARWLVRLYPYDVPWLSLVR